MTWSEMELLSESPITVVWNAHPCEVDPHELYVGLAKHCCLGIFGSLSGIHKTVQPCPKSLISTPILLVSSLLYLKQLDLFLFQHLLLRIF